MNNMNPAYGQTNNQLRQELRNKLEAEIFKVKDTKSPFISQEVIDSISTLDNIKTILREENWKETIPVIGVHEEEFSNMIRRIGTALSALVICSNFSANCLEFLMRSKSRRITDANLPLTPDRFDHFMDSAELETLKINGEFLPHQKYFCAMLEEDVYNLVIPDDFTSPISTRDSRGILGEGTVAMIIRIPSTNDRFKFCHGGKYEGLFFALKATKPNSANRDAAMQNQRSEAMFLTTMMKAFPHDHIARTYTAFWYRNDYRIISEMAGGDAEGLMTKIASRGRHTVIPTYTLEWLIQQMHGLSSALQKIHKRNNEIRGSHGDINIKNILVYFRDGVNAPPHLCLTDWGCYQRWTGPHASDRSRTSQQVDVYNLSYIFFSLLKWKGQGWLDHLRADDPQVEVVGKLKELFRGMQVYNDKLSIAGFIERLGMYLDTWYPARGRQG